VTDSSLCQPFSFTSLAPGIVEANLCRPPVFTGHDFEPAMPPRTPSISGGQRCSCAGQAAIRAGYSPKTAEVQGSWLLRNVKVQGAITASMAGRSKRTEVAADRALLEIARVGFSDLRRLYHEDGRLKHPLEWDDDTAASIASIEIATRSLADGTVEYVRKIKLWDKGKALEQLSKHLGLYRDQEPSEQPRDRPLSDTSYEELTELLLDKWARLGPLIEGEARRLRDR
jgi:phage terminase small subunit